ncbi:hypothetical protein MGG_17653 [Pyricularia oryzae 70-15]|uniref:Uncharacterized protein n=1 Tax=Pyricularia oryzae (strain 70-15 / ATCC MYA-4617 / FGSC 8958) TaxID=242507 RepID=G4NFE2_PYRO7|nr:uncharacterized protein MGG_17653 [Pyricularia oryzae 70-15]EHA47170.1 hypothetical protein MGG_17653 [Pyricularia oryzae 70-15]
MFGFFFCLNTPGRRESQGSRHISVDDAARFRNDCVKRNVLQGRKSRLPKQVWTKKSWIYILKRTRKTARQYSPEAAHGIKILEVNFCRRPNHRKFNQNFRVDQF